MERIEKSIDVHVPASVVYNHWTQFESSLATTSPAREQDRCRNGRFKAAVRRGWEAV